MLLKVFYDILPTKQRLHRLNAAISPTCDLCTDNCEGNIEHSLLECRFNQVNDWILGVVIDIDPNLIYEDFSSTNLLTLNLPLKPETRLVTTWVLSTVLVAVWRNKQSRKPEKLMSATATITGISLVFRNSK